MRYIDTGLIFDFQKVDLKKCQLTDTRTYRAYNDEHPSHEGYGKIRSSTCHLTKGENKLSKQNRANKFGRGWEGGKSEGWGGICLA